MDSSKVALEGSGPQAPCFWRDFEMLYCYCSIMFNFYRHYIRYTVAALATIGLPLAFGSR